MAGLKHEERSLSRVVNEHLIFEVLAVVAEIPEGRVSTYGQIARLVGRDKQSRLVGTILSKASRYGDYPCHRVVNHSGRLAPTFWEQRSRLIAEGVTFKPNGMVDLSKHLWSGED